jgi:hypothetical protein
VRSPNMIPRPLPNCPYLCDPPVPLELLALPQCVSFRVLPIRIEQRSSFRWIACSVAARAKNMG